jgi:pyridoxal phosphate enzyme (YggS family)
MGQYEKAWQATRARIAGAASAAGRSSHTITLLAVSKTFGPAAVRSVYALGQRAFGENYVQEALEKGRALADLPGLEWRLIGPLQGNKARAAAETFDWVETVDRLKIAERLAAARPPSRGALNVLVQVNASGEATKHGVAADEAVGLARDVSRLPGLTLRGIMGIPAPTPDPDEQRRQLRVLRDCFDACRAAGLLVDTLSMGMSADLEMAIAEGATEVRVGTAIFGNRETVKA